MSAAPPAEPTTAGFLDALGKSRLVPADLLAIAPAAVRDRPTALADYLVAAGRLTRFQADKLLGGFWHGLAIRHYRLLYPIGRGGMGIVYLARDGRPDRAGGLVALKVLNPQRARDEPRTLARFRREMEIGLALPTDPHLTRTHDAGEAGGVHYLAMEYVPGRTVHEIVTADGTLSVGAACRVFADAAAGLAAAHAAGFVHRDLKPGNVVVSAAGRAKVLDFGFALRVGEPAPDDPAVLGGPGHTVGTMDYLAPEQSRDAAGVGPAADVYALGCSLYFAVAGSPPFPGGSAQDKIRRHRAEYPDPIADVNPTVPAEFDRLVRWLLGKRPKDRPGSMAEVASVLAPWADPARGAVSAPDPGEVLRTVEARWQAHRADLTDETGGLLILDDPPARLRFRWWVIVAGAGLVGLAFLLGVVAAGR